MTVLFVTLRDLTFIGCSGQLEDKATFSMKVWGRFMPQYLAFNQSYYLNKPESRFILSHNVIVRVWLAPWANVRNMIYTMG